MDQKCVTIWQLAHIQVYATIDGWAQVLGLGEWSFWALLIVNVIEYFINSSNHWGLVKNAGYCTTNLVHMPDVFSMAWHASSWEDRLSFSHMCAKEGYKNDTGKGEFLVPREIEAIRADFGLPKEWWRHDRNL